MNTPTVEHGSRKVVEGLLLTALEGGKQVAVLYTRDDLQLVIDALGAIKLSGSRSEKRWQMKAGLLHLRDEAFGGKT